MIMQETLSRRWVLIAAVAIVTVAATVRSSSADSIGYFYGVNLISDAGSSLPQFDPSLGTLESVTLTGLAILIGDSVCLQNQDPNVGGTLTVTTMANWRLFVGDGISSLLSGSGTASESGYVAPYRGGPLMRDDTLVAYSSVGIPSQSITLDSGFADFVGNGFVPLRVEADKQVSWSSDPVDLPVLWVNAPPPNSEPNGSISGTVTYTYSPVPEPSVFALLGAAFLSVVAYGRRRR
jgi:hypothetical protein